jgi:hypothetical protein
LGQRSVSIDNPSCAKPSGTAIATPAPNRVVVQPLPGAVIIENWNCN